MGKTKSYPAWMRNAALSAVRVTAQGSPFRKAAALVQKNRNRVTVSNASTTPKTRPSDVFNNKYFKKTPGGTTVLVKNSGATQSKSAGFFKSKKYRKSKKQKVASKGVSMTTERFKEESTTTQALWVGHVSSPAEDVGKMMWRVILKRLMAKCGVIIRDFNDLAASSSYSVGAGDQVLLRYQLSDGATALLTHTITGANTWDQVADVFRLDATVSSAQTTLQNIQFQCIGAVATVELGSARLDLETLYVSLYCKSTMKIQNRTKNAVSDTMDSVDNVPLYGKLYGGKGNGAIQMKRGNNAIIRQLIAPYTTGYILGDANDPGQQEPIDQTYFQYVTRKGKLHLDPGYIKTSVLYHKQNISVQRLNQMLGVGYAATKTRIPLGKFTFFGIERMIDTSAIASPAAITVGLEINNYYSMSCYSRFNYATAPVFSRSVLP